MTCTFQVFVGGLEPSSPLYICLLPICQPLFELFCFTREGPSHLRLDMYWLNRYRLRLHSCIHLWCKLKCIYADKINVPEILKEFGGKWLWDHFLIELKWDESVFQNVFCFSSSSQEVLVSVLKNMDPPVCLSVLKFLILQDNIDVSTKSMKILNSNLTFAAGAQGGVVIVTRLQRYGLELYYFFIVILLIWIVEYNKEYLCWITSPFWLWYTIKHYNQTLLYQ